MIPERTTGLDGKSPRRAFMGGGLSHPFPRPLASCSIGAMVMERSHEHVPRSWEELDSMTDDEVLEQVRYTGGRLGGVSFNFWVGEMTRRVQTRLAEEQTELARKVKNLTLWVAIMTGVVVIATIVNLVLLLR